MASEEYDYAVVSPQWGQGVSANLDSGIVFNPHKAVTIKLPFKVVGTLVDEIRNPFKFPRGAPFGPCNHPDTKPCMRQLAIDAEMATSSNVDAVYGKIMAAMDVELADAYGMDLTVLKHGTARSDLQDVKKVSTVPILRTEGTAPADAHVFRTVAAKIRVMISIDRQAGNGDRTEKARC